MIFVRVVGFLRHPVWSAVPAMAAAAVIGIIPLSAAVNGPRGSAPAAVLANTATHGSHRRPAPIPAPTAVGSSSDIQV